MVDTSLIAGLEPYNLIYEFNAYRSGPILT